MSKMGPKGIEKHQQLHTKSTLLKWPSQYIKNYTHLYSFVMVRKVNIALLWLLIYLNIRSSAKYMESYSKVFLYLSRFIANIIWISLFCKVYMLRLIRLGCQNVTWIQNQKNITFGQKCIPKGEKVNLKLGKIYMYSNLPSLSMFSDDNNYLMIF